MTGTIGRHLREALFEAGWTQTDLARKTGIDKNTISALANDRSTPRPGTLQRIETALGLTPGTLAGLGEEPTPRRGDSLEYATDAELASELTYRLERLRRENSELRPRAEVEEARERQRQQFLASIGEDSPELLQGLLHEWDRLQYELAEGGGWGFEEESAYAGLRDRIDAEIFARDNGLRLVSASRPRPLSVAELKRRRLLADAVPVEEAAYEGDLE